MLTHGGTLFLDEIGDVPLSLQAKLLRALQEGEIEPLGSNKLLTFDARVISATSRDLGKLVREGNFREDLFYRLNVLQIRVPPLRERREDISALVEVLGEDMALRSGEQPRCSQRDQDRAHLQQDRSAGSLWQADCDPPHDGPGLRHRPC